MMPSLHQQTHARWTKHDASGHPYLGIGLKALDAAIETCLGLNACVSVMFEVVLGLESEGAVEPPLSSKKLWLQPLIGPGGAFLFLEEKCFSKRPGGALS